MGTTVKFDASVEPYAAINGTLVIARFMTSRPLAVSEIAFNPAVGIDPEIEEWAGFELDGRKASLYKRMRMTELFMRNHLENMAQHSGTTPPGGFRTFDPADDPDAETATTPGHHRDNPRRPGP